MANPWTKERLEAFIGMEESHQLEFKSSLGLLDSDKKVDEFFDKLTCHVSGFLNWEGGHLVIGIEETDSKDKKNAEKAVALSAGVPRSRWTSARIENKLCDRIHPAVASYVKVNTVIVGSKEDEDLLAFVVEVNQGVTAYQAADKHYYARRNFSSNPMEDKEIRLLMLSDEKPRGEPRFEVSLATYRPTIESYRGLCEHFRKRRSELISERGSVSDLTDEDRAELAKMKMTLPSIQLEIAVRLMLSNTGKVTIREGAVAAKIELLNQTFSMSVSGSEQVLERFSFNALDDSIPALYPDMEQCIREWKISVRDVLLPVTGTVLVSGVSVYLDNGPSVVRNKDFDLTEEVFNIINVVKRAILE